MKRISTLIILFPIPGLFSCTTTNMNIITTGVRVSITGKAYPAIAKDEIIKYYLYDDDEPVIEEIGIVEIDRRYMGDIDVILAAVRSQAIKYGANSIVLIKDYYFNKYLAQASCYVYFKIGIIK